MRRFVVLTVVLSATLIFASISIANSDANVVIAYKDGKTYTVKNFSFYTHHISPSGMYFKSSWKTKTGLIVKTGRIWKLVQSNDIKSLKMERVDKKQFLNAQLTLKNDETLKGEVPTKLHNTWYSGKYFWVEGAVKVFGKTGKFKKEFGNVNKLESIENEADKFKLNYFEYRNKKKIDSEKVIENIDFGFSGSNPVSRPSIYGMKKSLPISSEGVDVDIPLVEIKTIEFGENDIKLTLKNGDTGYITFRNNIKRIYGEIKPGEILFDNILPLKNSKIKSMEFK